MATLIAERASPVAEPVGQATAPVSQVAEAPRPIARKSLFKFDADALHEYVAFCPKCMTMETLSFGEQGLMPTRKFRQFGNRVYHACGSPQPCRLYRSC